MVDVERDSRRVCSQKLNDDLGNAILGLAFPRLRHRLDLLKRSSSTCMETDRSSLPGTTPQDFLLPSSGNDCICVFCTSPLRTSSRETGPLVDAAGSQSTEMTQRPLLIARHETGSLLSLLQDRDEQAFICSVELHWKPVSETLSTAKSWESLGLHVLPSTEKLSSLLLLNFGLFGRCF